MAALSSLLQPSSLAQVHGTTDSELYFRVIIEQIGDSSILDAVRSAVQRIRASSPYIGLNAMVRHPDTVVAVSSYDKHTPEGHPDDYYHLYYRAPEESVIVASSRWLSAGWTMLPNHSVLTIDRASLGVSITDIATG